MVKIATVFPSSLFFDLPFLEGFLRYIPHFLWSWPSICWSCRLLLEYLSHLSPSPVFCEWQQPMWYCLGVISSLMRPDRQLWAFNAEVTTFSWNCSSTMLPWLAHCVSTFLLGMPGEAIFKGMPLFFLTLSVGRGQDCSRRCLLATRTLFVHPWVFLPPRHGPCMKWARAAEFFNPTIPIFK